MGKMGDHATRRARRWCCRAAGATQAGATASGQAATAADVFARRDDQQILDIASPDPLIPILIPEGRN
jgi:hypothetical protein